MYMYPKFLFSHMNKRNSILNDFETGRWRSKGLITSDRVSNVQQIICVQLQAR